MTSAQFNIPQTVLDHYCAHYSNTTYRTFSDALAASLPGGANHPDHVAVMNMLTNAALERSGAEAYPGASVQLGTALMHYENAKLFTLAEQHLRQFNLAADETLMTAGLLHSLEAVRVLAASAGRVASDYHAWRGRMAFWWLGAIAYIAQAAYAVLSGSHKGYVQEKLIAAIRCLCDGVSEGAAADFVIDSPLMNWFTRFPLR